MADGSRPFIPELPPLRGNTPSERLEFLQHFDDAASRHSARVSRERKRKLKLSPEERQHVFEIRADLLRRVEKELSVLKQKEAQLVADMTNPNVRLEQLRSQERALHAEHIRVMQELHATEKSRSFWDRLRNAPLPDRYTQLAIELLRIEEQLADLREKIAHPGVVHIETLQHLAAVREKIADAEKDIAYRRRTLHIPEHLRFAGDDGEIAA